MLLLNVRKGNRKLVTSSKIESMREYFAALWVAMIVLMVATIFSELLRGMLVHGKVRKDAKFSAGFVSFLMRMEMKKSGWTYFYFIGAVYNLGITTLLVMVPHHPSVQQVLAILQSHHGARIAIRPDAVAVIGLLGVQNTRRFFESLFITEFGDAKMHVMLLVAGLIHYLGIAPSVLSSPQSRASPVATSFASYFLQVVGVALFVYASYHQYVCNKLLATQKAASGGKHVVPKGDWFCYVRCALYFAELLIYAAFSIICSFENEMVTLVFGWVVVNQSICALFAKQWYDNKFRDEQMPKWMLIPGVW